MNYEPPVITDALNTSHTSILLTWEEYQKENFNSESMTFFVTWQNIAKTNISHSYSDMTLVQYMSNQTLSMHLEGLRPFANYSINLNTFNDFGLGLASDIIYCRTNEWSESRTLRILFFIWYSSFRAWFTLVAEAMK